MVAEYRVDRTDDYWENFFSYCRVSPFEAWFIGSEPWIPVENIFFADVGNVEAHVLMNSFRFYIEVEIMSDHPFFIFRVICVPYLPGLIQSRWSQSHLLGEVGMHEVVSCPRVY